MRDEGRGMLGRGREEGGGEEGGEDGGAVG